MLSLTQVVFRAVDIYGKADDLYYRLKLQDVEADQAHLLEQAENEVDRLARANGFSRRQIEEAIEKMIPF